MFTSSFFHMAIFLVVVQGAAGVTYDELIKEGEKRVDEVKMFEAVKLFTQAIKIDPKNPKGYFYRAKTCGDFALFDKALNDINQCLRLEKTYPSALEQRALIYHSMKEYERAITDYSELLRLNPKHTQALIGRGMCFKGMREYGKAINDFRSVSKLQPNNPVSLYELAHILATCPKAEFRDGKKAIALATTASKLSRWKDPLALEALAAAYAEVGRYDDAIKWEKKAIDNYGVLEAEKIKGLYRLELYEKHKPYRDD